MAMESKIFTIQISMGMVLVIRKKLPTVPIPLTHLQLQCAPDSIRTPLIITENEPAGTIVGDFNAADPDTVPYLLFPYLRIQTFPQISSLPSIRMELSDPTDRLITKRHQSGESLFG